MARDILFLPRFPYSAAAIQGKVVTTYRDKIRTTIKTAAPHRHPLTTITVTTTATNHIKAIFHIIGINICIHGCIL